MSRIRRDLGVAAISKQVSTNTNNISSHTSSISTLNTKVSDHTSSIKTLNTTVSGHTTTITDQASSIRSLNTTVSDHTTTISNHTSSLSTINTDVTALKNKGWCIDGTSPMPSKNISITKTGEQSFTYTVQNDCYLVVTLHVNDEGNGHLLPDSVIRLKIGGRYVARFPRLGGLNGNVQFGVHVKKSTTVIVECNVEVLETGSYVGFSELKLS